MQSNSANWLFNGYGYQHGLSTHFTERESPKQETLLGKAKNPIRSSDEEQPKFTRRRLSQQLKQRSHNSRTPLGMLTSSTTLPSKHKTPIRSSDEEEPKFTRQRLLHLLKQPSDNSRTLSGMLTSSTPLPSKHETPIRSRDEEEPKFTRRRLRHQLKWDAYR